MYLVRTNEGIHTENNCSLYEKIIDWYLNCCDDNRGENGINIVLSFTLYGFKYYIILTL